MGLNKLKMPINDMLRNIPQRVRMGMAVLSFAPFFIPLATSTHYDRPADPGEFRAPEVRPVDYVPGYGAYTYLSRIKGTDSLSELAELSIEAASQNPALQILTLGTANWPHENMSEELKTAAYNVLLGGYRMAATGALLESPFFIYALTRKRN